MKKTLLTERFQKLAGIKPLYEQDDEDLRLEPEDDEYEDGTEFEDDDLRLEPEDDEYEDGTEFEDDDLRLEPEDDYVDEVELEDLDFKTLKAAFPKFYQKVKFTRTQPSGEEGPYYEDAITFPNADDSQTLIADESSLEDWKAKTLKRFGNVEIEFNDEAENWFDRVKIYDDAFADAKAGFTKGKQDFIDKERESGRSID
jgi:hypothetical protein